VWLRYLGFYQLTFDLVKLLQAACCRASSFEPASSLILLYCWLTVSYIVPHYPVWWLPHYNNFKNLLLMDGSRFDPSSYIHGHHHLGFVLLPSIHSPYYFYVI